MNPLIYTLIIYSLLLNLGGVIGFTKAGSSVSLIMGTLFGFAILGSALALVKQIRYAKAISLALSSTLLAVFVVRFIKTGAWMPAGMMTLASLIVVSLIIRSFVSAPQSKNL